MHLKISSTKSRPFCLGLDVLKIEVQITQSCCWYMRRARFKMILKIARNVKSTLISRSGKSQKLPNIEKSRKVIECIWLKKCSQALRPNKRILITRLCFVPVWLYQPIYLTSNGSWCMGIKGEMSGPVCVTFIWYMYIWVVYSFCLFCCLFIIVTTQFVALYKPCKPKPSTYDTPTPNPHPPTPHPPLAEIQRPILRPFFRNLVLAIYPQYWYWKTHKDIW